MKILALELSSARGSLAWLDGDRDPVVRKWSNDRKHSGEFFENLQTVTNEFGRAEQIIVGLGPGSYAGIRIAIAAAVGLGIAWNAPLAGFPSICAIESTTDDYVVIGDARRQSFFWAHIRGRDLSDGPTLFTEAELKEKLDKLENSMPLFSPKELPQFPRAIIGHPSALVLAQIAQANKRCFAMPPLEPIYLRDPHITIPKAATLVL